MTHRLDALRGKHVRSFHKVKAGLRIFSKKDGVIKSCETPREPLFCENVCLANMDMQNSDRKLRNGELPTITLRRNFRWGKK